MRSLMDVDIYEDQVPSAYRITYFADDSEPYIAILRVRPPALATADLDGRAIYGLSGALSAIYDFHRDKALMRDLNVRLQVCERTGVWEIAAVPDSLQALWSTRRARLAFIYSTSSSPGEGIPAHYGPSRRLRYQMASLPAGYSSTRPTIS
jgi:hypothetical protein